MTNALTLADMVVVAASDAEGILWRRVSRAAGTGVRRTSTVEQLQKALKEGVRLIVLGPSFPVAAIPAVREKTHGAFLAYCLDAEHVKDLDVVAQHVDTVVGVPEDVALLEEIVQSALAGERPANTWRPLIRRSLEMAAVLSLWIFIWWVVVKVFSPPEYLLPSPVDVATSFVMDASGYLRHALITAAEAAGGFLIGNFLGFLVGVLLYRSATIRRLVLPMVIVSQSIPLLAVAPLLIVWLGAGPVSKVAMATLLCFFPMTINTISAFNNVDSAAQDLFSLYKASFDARLRMLLVPASLPALVSALRISAGLCVVGAIVAEFTGADAGIGFLLLTATYRLDTVSLFVAIALSAVLGGTFYLLPGLITRLQRS